MIWVGPLCPLRVTSRLHGHCIDTSALRAEADVIGGKADVEIEGLLSGVERSDRRVYGKELFSVHARFESDSG